MKKGFTLIEVMATIVILAIVLIIAVPVYNGVRDGINENIYESKIQEVLAKAESYASENHAFVFDIKTLIEDGKISADNETGVYIDPRTGRDMRCDVINALYKENRYEVSITESEICYRLEELENLYGIVNLKLYNQEDKEIEKLSDTEWIKEGYVKVRYEFKEEYKEYEEHIEHVEWIGECDAANSNESVCVITTNEIKNATVSLELTINMDGVEIKNQVQKNILIDLQRPSVIDGSVNVNNELSTNNERRVEFEISDGSGSGVKSYSIVKEKSCSGKEYEENKQIASDGVQSIYLGNGDYYICVEDKVGNKTSNEDLENSKNQIHVEGVDTSIPVISSFSVKSKESGYNDVDTILGITASDDGGVNGLEMCISNSGYLQGCSWEKYSTSKNWKVTGSLDGKERTVYLSIRDNAGNVVNREAKYTVYKDCSNQKKEYTESSYGTCSKSCGGGIQYRAYRMKDSKTGTICTTGKDSKTCNTQSCAPTVTRVGDYVKGLLVPLNSSQVVIFTAGKLYPSSSATYDQRVYYSYVDGQVINIASNGSVSFGSVVRVTEGRNSLGMGPYMAAKVDNNRIVFGGLNSTWGSRTSQYEHPGAMMIQVSGNNMWAYNKVKFGNNLDNYYNIHVRVKYIQGSETASIDFYGENKNGYPDRHYYSYNINTVSSYQSYSKKTNSWNDSDPRYFTDVESLVDPPPDVVRDRLYEIDNFTPLDKNTKAWEAVASHDGDVYGISVGPASANYRSQDYVLFPPETYSEYGNVESMTHFGNSKFVALTSKRERVDRNYVYHKYLLYFKNENGTWKRTHAIKAPDSTASDPGDLVAINDTYAFYNSEDGLYLIKYDS